MKHPEEPGSGQGTGFDFGKALGEQSQSQQNFPPSQGAAGQAGVGIFSQV